MTAWRTRAEQTPDAYLGAYCCAQGTAIAQGVECPDHPGFGAVPGALLDLRRAHGLRWDDLPEDMTYGAALARYQEPRP